MNVGDFVGKTATRIEKIEEDGDIARLRFFFSDGTAAEMYHKQDCCECVYLYETIGEFKDLMCTPILKAEESQSDEDGGEKFSWDTSHTWTFYNFTTVKGHVTLRWLGTSNGCYSEEVSIRSINGAAKRMV